MLISVNGAQRQLPDGSTMAALVATMELDGQRFAIEVNEELVPRSTFENYRLSEQDRVEIVQAIGGG